MTTMTTYSEGSFCWVDLSARDLDAATSWYADLFGWTPVRQDTSYVMFENNGHTVAGAGPMSEEMRRAGAPPTWNSYISVEDAAATEARARELGATITAATMKVMDAGWMCFIEDPGGALFGLWQPGQHRGASLVNEPGSVTWNELATRDVDAAKRFYGALLGWTFEPQPMATFEYTTIKTADGRENGGIMPMLGSQWEGVPTHWAIYFAVSAIEDTVRRVAASGGAIHVPVTVLPRVGRFAVVADPQGATFTVLELG